MENQIRPAETKRRRRDIIVENKFPKRIQLRQERHHLGNEQNMPLLTELEIVL
jgi:hypothetical protein